MSADDYDDGEERGDECEIWKEKEGTLKNECHIRN